MRLNIYGSYMADMARGGEDDDWRMVNDYKNHIDGEHWLLGGCSLANDSVDRIGRRPVDVDQWLPTNAWLEKVKLVVSLRKTWASVLRWCSGGKIIDGITRIFDFLSSYHQWWSPWICSPWQRPPSNGWRAPHSLCAIVCMRIYILYIIYTYYIYYILNI